MTSADSWLLAEATNPIIGNLCDHLFKSASTPAPTTRGPRLSRDPYTKLPGTKNQSTKFLCYLSYPVLLSFISFIKGFSGFLILNLYPGPTTPRSWSQFSK